MKRRSADAKKPRAVCCMSNTCAKKSNADAKKSNADAKKSNADAKKQKRCHSHRHSSLILRLVTPSVLPSR